MIFYSFAFFGDKAGIMSKLFTISESSSLKLTWNLYFCCLFYITLLSVLRSWQANQLGNLLCFGNILHRDVLSLVSRGLQYFYFKDRPAQAIYDPRKAAERRQVTKKDGDKDSPRDSPREREKREDGTPV